MPTVVLTNEYILPEQEGHKAAAVRVSGRTVPDIFAELAARFPRFAHLLFTKTGELRWFYTLLHASDDGLEDVRYLPDDMEFGDEDTLHLFSNAAD